MAGHLESDDPVSGLDKRFDEDSQVGAAAAPAVQPDTPRALRPTAPRPFGVRIRPPLQARRRNTWRHAQTRLHRWCAPGCLAVSVTKNLSKSLAKDGILVNCVCPGTIVTASFTEQLHDILAAEGLDATDPHDVMTWIENNFHQPCDLGRAGLPEEVASITTYLASLRNGYVTGATVNVDGGSDFV